MSPLNVLASGQTISLVRSWLFMPGHKKLSHERYRKMCFRSSKAIYKTHLVCLNHGVATPRSLDEVLVPFHLALTQIHCFGPEVTEKIVTVRVPPWRENAWRGLLQFRSWNAWSDSLIFHEWEQCGALRVKRKKNWHRLRCDNTLPLASWINIVQSNIIWCTFDFQESKEHKVCFIHIKAGKEQKSQFWNKDHLVKMENGSIIPLLESSGSVLVIFLSFQC